jgi:hypothetical protein
MVMLDRRTFRVWGYLGAAMLGSVAMVATLPLLVGRPWIDGRLDATRLLLWTLVIGLAMVWGFAFAARSFRSADEFAQHGSQVSWYWGAAIGLAASAPIFVFIALGGLHWLWSGIPTGPHLTRAFVVGYSLPVVMQLIGVMVVRAWWRMSRR